MEIQFWGVRGSIAVSGEQYLRTGGNTSCVEVRHAGERLVLDGGTGLRALGDSLGFSPQRLTLVFSHVHWDHIQGVPFFNPAFHPDSQITLIGADRPSGSIRDALARQMTPPQWPIGLDAFRAQLDFRGARTGQSFEIGPFRLTPIDLHHPDGVLAWRIEAGGTSLVYATDVEHDGTVDRRLLAAAAGTDLLIHDAQYTDAEYRGQHGPSRRGWGHSTWTEAARCAYDARAQRVALFHHDPSRPDQAVSDIEHAARSIHPGAFAAREGAVVSL
jgi:phosphoribosyl 1,2-cyclic phosphodiesterase